MRRKRLARRAALCYTVGEIRAAHRAVRDIAVYRTYCRTEKKGRHIRAAKRQIEPRSARLPEARISKPYPRKGTETSHYCSGGKRAPCEFQNHIPARGRKLSKCRSLSADIAIRFQNHIPARGRKLFILLLVQTERKKISKPYPRKGTETIGLLRLDLSISLFQNHIPARGRKHQSDRDTPHDNQSFQNHIPARGRNVRTPASPAAAGEGDHAKHGGRGASNDLRISIVRNPHPPQAPLPARTARHLPRSDGGGE